MSDQFPHLNPYEMPDKEFASRWFYGRHSILQQINHLIFFDVDERQNQPIILTGLPRLGKTALLQHIQTGVLGPNIIPIYINLEKVAIDSLSAFYWDVANTATAQLEPYELDLPQPTQAAYIGTPAATFQEQFLQPACEALTKLGSSNKLLLLFDNLQSFSQNSNLENAGQISPQAIHKLIHQYEAAACLFTWRGAYQDFSHRHPAWQLARLIEIDRLDEDSAVDLIRKPVSYIIVRDVALYINQLAGGRPYTIRKICSALFERQQQYNLKQITAADVAAVITQNPALLPQKEENEAPVFAIASESGGRRTVRHVRRLPAWQKNSLLAIGSIFLLILAVILLFPIFTGQSATRQLASALEDPTATPTAVPPTATITPPPEPSRATEAPATVEIIVTAVTVIAPTETPQVSPTPTATQTGTPTPLPNVLPRQITREQDQMPMLLVPAGTFLMGSAEDDFRAARDEMPQHEVSLDAFYMDKYEVNVEQYASFLNRMGTYIKACDRVDCAWPRELAGYTSYLVEQDLGDGTVQYFPLAGFSQYPINHVSWYGADLYCQSVGARLPTEAEWEYAARGDDGRIYPWGNENPDPTRAVYNSDSFENVKAVDALPDGASPFGIFGMAGSMWEWTADWYSDTYYEESPRRNPTGPEAGLNKVVRGGAWPNNNLADRIRATNRNAFAPDIISALIGFRCVRNP